LEQLIIALKSFFTNKHGHLLIEKIAQGNGNISGVLTSIRNFLDKKDAHKRIVILGISGEIDHWTCVRKVTNNEIHFLDSDNMDKKIKHKSFTCGKYVKKPFVVSTQEVWGLRWKD